VLSNRPVPREEGLLTSRRLAVARWLADTHASFLSFPYVCPEPVLVK
jgi:hypothetical protein